MSTISTRHAAGFLAGVLSHLIFQGVFGSILYAADVLSSLPWSLTPVPRLGVPKSLSLGFWAGLWGLTYTVLERWLTARFTWWIGGLVFGLALPLVAHWFVVLPLKGLGVGSGFHLEIVPIEVGFHALFGVGTAIIFRSALVLAGHRAGTQSQEKVNVARENTASTIAKAAAVYISSCCAAGRIPSIRS